MSISISLRSIVAAAIAAAVATLVYWLVGLLGGQPLLQLFFFGFTLLVLSVSIQIT